MKPTLLFTTLILLLASPSLMAKSEIETLRSLCKEQERQIKQLEDENANLRPTGGAKSTKSINSESAPTPTEKVAAVAPTAAALSTQTTSSTYTVKAGDSIEKIARKVGTSSEKLCKANGLKSSSIIRPGQTLKVSGKTSSVSPTATAKSTPPTSGAKSHKVMPGETFFSISKKHGMSTGSLIAANPSVKPSTLRPGQVVSLVSEKTSTQMISTSAKAPEMDATQAPTAKASAPVPKNIPVSTPAPKPTPAPAPVSKPAPAPAPPAVVESKPIEEKSAHAVSIESEMTYGDFADKHGTNTERLNALNGLDLTKATVLAKGSELLIPAQP